MVRLQAGELFPEKANLAVAVAPVSCQSQLW
jgi:hypothetical protein